MKTISILIAAYEAQDWLADCLNGVFSQCLPAGWRMQVLLGIDACSKTDAALRALDFPALEVVRLRQNRGTYVTFNTLMTLAQGELIARFDADDVMQAGYLSAHIRALQTGSDMSMSWSIYTDAQLQPTSHVMAHEVYHPENGLNRRAAEGQFVIRREVWQQLGGFRPWRCGADTDFFKRARVAGFKHSVVEQFLYLRRTHRQSLTVHAETNFKSPYRLLVQKLTEKHDQQRQAGRRPLRVHPVIAKDVEYLKPLFSRQPPTTIHARISPMYSVIIPTYNRRELLAQALDSVLQQPYGDIEIIVIDDGSDDGSAHMLAQNYPAVRHVCQSNQGPAAARNRGIALARGELIAFLDSDDIWLPNKIGVEMALLQRFPEADMLAGNADTFIEGILRSADTFAQREIPFHDQQPRFFDWSLPVMKLGPVCCTSGILIKRHLLNRMGEKPFDETLRLDEDWDLEFRLFSQGKALLYPTRVCTRRMFDDHTRHFYSVSGKSKSQEEQAWIWRQKKHIISRYLNNPHWDHATRQGFQHSVQQFDTLLQENLSLSSPPHPTE